MYNSFITLNIKKGKSAVPMWFRMIYATGVQSKARILRRFWLNALNKKQNSLLLDQKREIVTRSDAAAVGNRKHNQRARPNL